MKFKDWWITNEEKINKLANFWLLPKKLKVIVKIIITAIDTYLETEANIAVTTIDLKDVNVEEAMV